MVYDDNSVVLGSIVECSMFSSFFIFIQCFLGLEVALSGSGLILCRVFIILRDKDLHNLVYKLR